MVRGRRGRVKNGTTSANGTKLTSADEPETVRAQNGLCSLLHIELNEDMLDVRFDGLGCDAKTSCDFLVG